MKKGSPIFRAAIILLLVITLALSGCVTYSGVDPGAVQTVDMSVELGQAQSVKALVNVRTSADVTIRDGASALLDASLTYNQSLKPGLSYNVNGTVGTLNIEQPASQNLESRKLDNRWDLRFGTEAPVGLTVKVTSGNTNVEIAAMRLAALAVDTSSGNFDATIGGKQQVLRSVAVSTTSGTIGLDLDGEFPGLESLSLDESSGNIDLVTSGSFASISSLQVKDTSGNTTLDLGGVWSHNLTSTIRTSSGNVTIKLPSGVGIKVTTNVSSGTVNATGLRLADGAYVNDAYGTSPVTLTFDIHVTSGTITVKGGE